jgi:hypothetical protein
MHTWQWLCMCLTYDFTLEMEGVHSSETLVNVSQKIAILNHILYTVVDTELQSLHSSPTAILRFLRTAWHCNPENHTLHSGRRDNLKFNTLNPVWNTSSEVVGVCIMHEEIINNSKYTLENIKEKYCFWDLVVDGGIVLKQMLDELCVKVRTGFRWLRIRSRGKLFMISCRVTVIPHAVPWMWFL